MSRNSEKEFDRARDDLFSHIHRCGVLRAEQDQQSAWLDDTVEYMAECYPSLTREELGELRTIGRSPRHEKWTPTVPTPP